MERSVFDKFRRLVFDTSGISLSDQKMALVSSRIGKRMRVLGMADYGQYFQQVENDKSGAELRELINAISTNVTHFFREARHFECMSDVLKQWQSQGQSAFRIWCAACSTGEEPYTILMTGAQALGSERPISIVASDISTKVLGIAKFGVYKDDDVSDIAKPVLKRYFQQGVGRAAALYRIRAELRNRVTFQQINLSTPPYPVQGGLDMIFCRNVMIYFDQDLRFSLVRNFTQLLRPGGYLFLGMAESLSGAHKDLKSVEPSVYQKQG